MITHFDGDRFPVGEPDGTKSERARALADALSAAGFKSRVLADIRSHLWVKAWGNLAFNPISALTGATLGEICRTPATRALAAQMMTEASRIAEALGVSIRISVERRIAGAEAVGEHKTSMLQDAEAGRPLELDPLVGVFVELGELTGVPTPRHQLRLRPGLPAQPPPDGDLPMTRPTVKWRPILREKGSYSPIIAKIARNRGFSG